MTLAGGIRPGLVFLILMAYFSPRLFSAQDSKELREIELGSVETRIMPYLGLDSPQQDSFEEDVQIQVRYANLGLAAPPKTLSPNLKLMTVAAVETYEFDYHGWTAEDGPHPTDQVYAVQMIFGLTQSLKDPRRSWRYSFRPSYNSDFKSVTWKSLRLQGGVIHEWKNEGGSRWGLGLVLINNFGTPLVLPSLSFNKTTEHSRWQILAPVVVSGTYLPTPDWEMGLAFRVRGNNFRLEEDGPYKGKNADYSMGSVSGTIAKKITPHIKLSLEAGHTVFHQFDIRERRQSVADFDPKNGPFVSFGIKVLL